MHRGYALGNNNVKDVSKKQREREKERERGRKREREREKLRTKRNRSHYSPWVINQSMTKMVLISTEIPCRVSMYFTEWHLRIHDNIL